jgi:hypothetical protein
MITWCYCSNRTLTAKFKDEITIVTVNISDNMYYVATHKLTSIQVRRTITGSASSISLQISGNEYWEKWNLDWTAPDHSGNKDASMTFTKDIPVEWYAYYEYWIDRDDSITGIGQSSEYQWKTYTLIVDDITVIKDKIFTRDGWVYPIINETIRIGSIDYIITFTYIED